MNKIFSSYFFLVFVLAGLMSVTASANAADRYRVSAQFYHLGELIAQPMMEVVEGDTTAGTYSGEGRAQYKVAVLVRPVADGEVYVSMSFSSGKTTIQPNLMAEIGKPRSATIKKIRMNLLVEEVKADELENQQLAQQQ